MAKELKFTLSPLFSGTPQVLDHSPDGYDDASIVWERSITLHGMTRSFSMPLRFVKNGATILRREYYDQLCLAQCDALVEKLNKRTLKYYTAFRGVVDFASFQDEVDHVQCNFISSGLAQFYKDQSKEEYDIPNYLWPYTSGAHRDVAIYEPINGTDAFYALRPFQLFKWLTDKMTNGNVSGGLHYNVRSDILTSQYWNDKIAIASGASIRYAGITSPIENANKITTSMDDFIKSINAIIPIGVQVEIDQYGNETLRLEPWYYFYKKDLLFDVGEVNNFSLKWVDEWRLRNVKLSYPEKEFDSALETKFEINSYSNFKNTDHTHASDKILELESKYRADWAGIYKILTEYAPGVDDNDNWDDNIWFIDMKRGPKVDYIFAPGSIRQKLPVGYSTPQTWYNCLFSPRHNLGRHLPFINNLMPGLNGYPLKFITGGYYNRFNESYSANDGGQLIWQKEYDPMVSLQPGDFFQPYELTFEAPYPGNYLDLINANPNALISFWYRGFQFKGYFRKMEIKLQGRGKAKYTLISYAGNELWKLKH